MQIKFVKNIDDKKSKYITPKKKLDLFFIKRLLREKNQSLLQYFKTTEHKNILVNKELIASNDVYYDEMYLKSKDLEKEIQRLVNDLSNPDFKMRVKAVLGLGQIGPTAKRAVSNIIDALKYDENADVRRFAAQALGKIGICAKDTLDALINALKDKDSYVCASAANALGNMGAEAEDAIIPLVNIVIDENYPEHVCKAAAGALGRIGQKALGELINKLDDANSYIRNKSAWALGEAGISTVEVTNALKKTIRRDKNKEVVKAAAEALKKLTNHK